MLRMTGLGFRRSGKVRTNHYTLMGCIGTTIRIMLWILYTSGVQDSLYLCKKETFFFPG